MPNKRGQIARKHLSASSTLGQTLFGLKQDVINVFEVTFALTEVIALPVNTVVVTFPTITDDSGAWFDELFEDGSQGLVVDVLHHSHETLLTVSLDAT